ncbi:hypothetical protein GCM10010232_66090 [Streptomyces amakusaensis]|uniref:Uncharacterized protein n=1 Tax=Streptomyces amakusaensis TaxID=67271 RepID=A0ABW0ARH1_9ACTN
MTTSVPSSARTPGLPQSGCPFADRVSRTETPMLTAMAAAMFHLEHLVETVGTPEQERAAHTAPVSAEHHREYVLGNAARIRRALDELTAPYETTATDTSTTTADTTTA